MSRSLISDEVERQRRRVEERLALVQRSLHREVGWRPAGKGALLTLLAAAAGFAVGMSMRRRRS